MDAANTQQETNKRSRAGNRHPAEETTVATPAVATSGGAVAQTEPVALARSNDNELRVIGRLIKTFNELPDSSSKIRALEYLTDRFRQERRLECDETRRNILANPHGGPPEDVLAMMAGMQGAPGR